jgi:hypothetical protein
MGITIKLGKMTHRNSSFGVLQNLQLLCIVNFAVQHLWTLVARRLRVREVRPAEHPLGLLSLLYAPGAALYVLCLRPTSDACIASITHPSAFVCTGAQELAM